ncbi:glycosyltransferase [Candidatus Microgenomates bacterium]|nr:MAG: glycosyltransferase [Candidatus Microgenomates bacterium]
MNRKRIAMISLHACPLASKEGEETGGMNVYVLELSKKLSESGFIIDIFTRIKDKEKPKIVLINKNLRVIHLKAGPEEQIPKKEIIQHIPEFVKNFNGFKSSEKINYDILHCHYYLSGLAGLSIKETSKIPLIITFHTLGLMKNLVARNELETEEKERIKIEKTLGKKADKVIALSQSDGNYLQYLYEIPKEKIMVINPGIDTEIFKPIDKEKAKSIIKADINHKIILFVGRIEPLKAIDVLLYALKILYEKNPSLSFCLWIVGGKIARKNPVWPQELQKLEELAKTLNIRSVIKFVGQKPNTELPFYFNASEFVVIPSHYESFGMATLEAMACGIPVITTNVSGVSSLFDKKHQKLVTSSNNPLLLAKQMENLLINKKEHKNLSGEISKKVEDLSWEKIAKKITIVYRSLFETMN